MLSLRPALWLTPLSFFIASHALSQGYYVDEQSALRLGDAFSAGAAAIDDASTAYYNPAAMLKVGNQWGFNASVIHVRSDFDGMASTGDGSTAILGKPARANNVDVLPTFYYVQQLNDNIAFGAFINAPYATGTNFGKQSVGRYHVTQSEITGINTGLSMALKANDKINLGASLIIQYFDANSEVAINTSAICYGAEANGDLGPFSCNDLGIASTSLGSNKHDGLFVMRGKNTAIGFSAGALIDITKQSRLGMSYRSRIVQDLRGKASVTFPSSAAIFTGLADLPNTTATGDVQMVIPESANISYVHDFSNWGIQTDIGWTRWSRFQELAIQSSNTTIAALTEIPTDYQWDDSYRLALGGYYTLSPQITLRAGFAIDQTPIPDSKTKLDFPFDDYHALSMGMSYALNSSLTLDVGYQHTLQQKRALDQNELTSSGSRLNGNVTTTVHSLALGVRRAF